MNLYFARIEDDGPFKIGVTDGLVADRIALLQCGCPWPIRIVGSIVGTREQELFLHRKLAAHRISGEWFEPKSLVTETIAAILGGFFSFPNLPPAQISFREFFLRLRNALGGEAAMARTLDLEPNVISKWFRRHRIPSQYWSEIVSVAQRNGLEYVTAQAILDAHAWAARP